MGLILLGACLMAGWVEETAWADGVRLEAPAVSRAALEEPRASVRVGGSVQVRFTTNRRDAAPAGSEDVTLGTSIHRAKVAVSGALPDETWTWRVVGSFNSATGGAALADGWVAKEIEGVRIGAGQFKPAFLLEELIDITRQAAVDRSVVNETFNQGRSQGVWAEWADSDWRVVGSITDGFNSANTEFTGAEADFGLTLRGEFVVDGHRRALEDFAGFPDGDFALRVGGAGHFESGGKTAAGVPAVGRTADVDRTGLTLDAQAEGDSWSAFAAIVWVSSDPAGGIRTDDVGLVVQGTWMPTEHWQVFARFDVVMQDDAVNPAIDAFPVVTVGGSWFVIPESHALKITADVQVALEAFGAGSIVPAAGGGAGVFGAGSATSTSLVFDTGDPQTVFRVQVQGTF